MNNLLNLIKQPVFTTSLLERFIDGETLANCLLKNCPQGTFFTRFFQLHPHLLCLSHNHLPLHLQALDLSTSTIELALVNKKMISRDKSLSHLNIIHRTLLSQILDQVLTSNDQDLENFLDWLCPIVSKKLSLLAKTAYVDLDLNLSNGFVLNTIQNSWFSIKIQTQNQKANLLETSSLLSKSMHVNGMANDDTLIRARKIKLKLTSSQKQFLNQWNDHHRYTYNSAIYRLQTDIDKPSKFLLRNQLVAAQHVIGREWLLDTPKEIRARAVFEAHTRVWTGMKQIQNKTIRFFEMKFKTKKQQKQKGWCIEIPKQAITKINSKTIVLYKRITKKSEIRLTEALRHEIENDCKLQFDGLDYYFIVPIKVSRKQSQLHKRNIISLDPGIRTFLSGFDTETTIEIGDKANEKMYPLLKKLDRYIGRAKTTKTKKEKHVFSMRIKQLRKRIKNLQTELHKKVSTWLCKNYNHVIIPNFESKEMSKKQGRKIRTKTVRQMTVLGHKTFIEKLKTKAEEMNVKVVFVDESYTSKTCASCENEKKYKFTGKRYKCQKCGLNIDRDTNGAINIAKKLFRGQIRNWADRA